MDKSLDPRLNRLGLMTLDNLQQKEVLDQLPTFEVFVKSTTKRPIQHEGIVHAVNAEMAFVFAKEQFSRRNMCFGIWTVSTDKIYITPFSDNAVSIYDQVSSKDIPAEGETFDIFHLMKRGKQHQYAGQVSALNYEDAIYQAKNLLKPEKPVLNIWVIKDTDIYKSTEEDLQIWQTLQEKTFRDATDYRGSDKIKEFKQQKG